jgi:crotonobetainyl-CoA:carnitine CoA-transferase CaiB-like acyl-CoA transferase
VYVAALLTLPTPRPTCYRYNTAVKRYRARRTLGREIEAIFLKDSMVGWLAELEAAGCIAGSVAPLRFHVVVTW